MRPLLFSIGEFGFRSYGLLTLAAYAAGAFYFRLHKRAMGLSGKDFWNLALSAVAGALVGGKLGGLLLYYQGPWDGPGTVFRGGLSFYQGFWVGALFVYLYCRAAGKSFAVVADHGDVAVPLGHAVGRLGCFLNGCCYGQPTTLPWAVAFVAPAAHIPQELRGVPLHPTQLYEAAGNIALALGLHRLLRRQAPRNSLPAGSLAVLYVLAYAASRFALEALRSGAPGRLHGPLTTAQWCALLSAAAGAYFWLRDRSLVLAYRK